MSQEQKPQQNNFEENPPFFNSWKTWYVGVLIYLGTLILLFHLFTKIFE